MTSPALGRLVAIQLSPALIAESWDRVVKSPMDFPVDFTAASRFPTSTTPPPHFVLGLQSRHGHRRFLTATTTPLPFPNSPPVPPPRDIRNQRRYD